MQFCFRCRLSNCGTASEACAMQLPSFSRGKKDEAPAPSGQPAFSAPDAVPQDPYARGTAAGRNPRQLNTELTATSLAASPLDAAFLVSWTMLRPCGVLCTVPCDPLPPVSGSEPQWQSCIE